jgi:hypothetical protein
VPSYDHGAQARIDDEPLDTKQPKCWQNGWLDADKEIAEHGIPALHSIQSHTR